MSYLTKAAEIRTIISQLAMYPVLWLDTEIADWWTPNPKLSLIQALADPGDRTGSSSYILDVLNQPDLVQLFIEQIMANPQIEKVFHNASFDLKYLGKHQACNVTCTLKIAKGISLAALGTSNLKLKTLAEELCQFTEVDPEQQSSNWGKRPLSDRQLLYAKMDTVYLAHVHRRLLDLKNPTPVVPVPPSQKAPSFSVTKVRVAFECARLFYLAHHFNSPTLFFPKGQVLGLGKAFHDLSDRFANLALREPQFQVLLEPEPDQLQVEKIASQLQDLFYRLEFFPYLQAAIQEDPSKSQALLQLWEGLKGLIRRWAELLVSNRRSCKASEVISKTFLAQEIKVQHSFPLPDGNQQLVQGQLDSLVYDFTHHRLCVVEYKTYQSPDPSAQLAQVALYSYMLREKVGVPINSAVYSVLPDWKELTFTWDELEQTVHQLIPHKLLQMRQWANWQPGQPDPPPSTSQPHLCEICPQRIKCQTYFEAASVQLVVKPEPQKPEPQKPVSQPPQTPSVQPVPVASVSAETEAIAHQLVTTLRAFNIDVDYEGAIAGPAVIRVKLKPSLGVKVSSILRSSDDLRVQLSLSASPLIAPQAGYVSVDLPRPDRQTAHFDQYLQPQQLSSTDPVRIAIGVNLEGQLVEADLSDPNTCHFLVGGTTGSGKSEFLRSLLLSLLIRHSPQQLKIVLIDPKRVTFPEFEQMPWLYAPVVKESDRAIELMETLVAEMDRRYQRFEATGCNDLSNYNQKFQQQPAQQLPRIVCIFDEYADFMVEKESRNALELSIKRLGAMARAAGIHLIVATQRPEAKVVTPIIRSNLPGRVALRTASEADSAIVLGGRKTAASDLLGKGDLLYLAGAHPTRLQSLFASGIQLSQLLQISP